MKALISFLEQHRWLNILLILLYAAGILMLHDHFVQLSVYVMNTLSLPVYNRVVMGVTTTAGFTIIVYTFVLFLRNRSARLWPFVLLLITVLITTTHVLLMFEMNIEIIHSLEYAGLASLVFPFTKRISSTLACCLPIMLADELHQYLVLYPTYNPYFELSDVGLDILGSATWLLLLVLTGVKIRDADVSIKQPEVFIPLAALLLFIAGTVTGYFALHEQTASQKTIFIFSHVPNHTSFWHIHPFTQAKYHIMKPVEGVMYITGLLLFFSYADARLSATIPPSKIL